MARTTPVPLWLSYPALFLLSLVHIHLPLWLDGAVPAGSLHLPLVLSGLWFSLQAGLIHYLDRQAGVQSFHGSTLYIEMEVDPNSWRPAMEEPNKKIAACAAIIAFVYINSGAWGYSVR